MSGVLYGVGVGPGDPELLTLKAHRLISNATTVAYPAPDSGDSFARSIVAGFIPTAAREIPIVIPMRTERFPAQAVYDRAADEIAEALQHGDVVVLCEGDPFFYGSFMYLFARLAGRAEVRIVPGVTSMTACAAAVQRPLCARNEVLSALPATLPDDELRALIARPAGALAIMKVGRHLPRVRALLAEAGLEHRAAFVSHASLPHQQAMPLAEAPDTAPYFSMILVPGDDPHAGS